MWWEYCFPKVVTDGTKCFTSIERVNNVCWHSRLSDWNGKSFRKVVSLGDVNLNRLLWAKKFPPYGANAMSYWVDLSFLHHDARHHTARQFQELLPKIKWKFRAHFPCCPNLTHSEYFFSEIEWTQKFLCVCVF